MKKRKKKEKVLKIRKADFMKAIRKADREMELSENTGWKAVKKIHKSKKQYNRKENKTALNSDE